MLEKNDVIFKIFLNIFSADNLILTDIPQQNKSSLKERPFPFCSMHSTQVGP